MVKPPRTKAEYEWAMYEAEGGGPKPRAPTVTELAAWSQPTMSEVLGTPEPTAPPAPAPEPVMAEPKPKKPNKADRQAKFYADNEAYRSRELAAAQAQHALAPDGRTAMQLQFADAEHGLAQSQRAEFLAGSPPATATTPAPPPTPAPEPVMAEPKPKKTRAGPVKPDLGYQRSSGSMPRVQPDLFGVPPQPAVTPYVPPDVPVYGPTTGTYPEAGAYPHTSPQGPRTYGGTFADMARTSGNDVRAVTGGDLFGDMPTRPGPSTAYSSIMDADPSASPRPKFALDTRTQGLARVTGRAPNMVELRPGIETPYTPPHDPAAYGTGPMIAERSPAATYGGQGANFAKGPTAYDARPSMLSRVGGVAGQVLRGAGIIGAPLSAAVAAGTLADSAERYTHGAGGVVDPIGVMFDPGEAQYGTSNPNAMPMSQAAPLAMRQMLGLESAEPAAQRQARAMSAPGPAPYERMVAQTYRMQGGSGSPDMPSGPHEMPLNARGQGYADPRMIRGLNGGGMVSKQVARPMPRPMPRPAPWQPMQVDPSILYQGGAYANMPLPAGNANIDDETRRHAYRAMGMLP